MYTYRQILTQAFKIAWQNPGLWFFGFFIALWGGGELELMFGGYGFGGQETVFSFWQGLAEGGLFTIAGLKGAVKILFANPLYLFVILLLGLAVLGLTALFLWLIAVSQTAVIGQAEQEIKLERKFWPGPGKILAGFGAEFGFADFFGSAVRNFRAFDPD